MKRTSPRMTAIRPASNSPAVREEAEYVAVSLVGDRQRVGVHRVVAGVAEAADPSPEPSAPRSAQRPVATSLVRRVEEPPSACRSTGGAGHLPDPRRRDFVAPLLTGVPAIDEQTGRHLTRGTRPGRSASPSRGSSRAAARTNLAGRAGLLVHRQRASPALLPSAVVHTKARSGPSPSLIVTVPSGSSGTAASRSRLGVPSEVPEVGPVLRLRLPPSSQRRGRSPTRSDRQGCRRRPQRRPTPQQLLPPSWLASSPHVADTADIGPAYE